MTCKVNEHLVLSMDEVKREMLRLGVVHFRGDWTLRDEEIRVELERRGRAGVPLCLVYRPRAPDDPEILPEVLTTDRDHAIGGEDFHQGRHCRIAVSMPCHGMVWMSFWKSDFNGRI